MRSLTTPALRTLRRPLGLAVVAAALLLAAVATGQDRPPSYEIQPGDTFSRIARHFGCSVAELRAANPDLSDTNAIFAGDTLAIPACEGASPPREPAAGERSYVIHPGDFLERIA